MKFEIRISDLELHEFRKMTELLKFENIAAVAIENVEKEIEKVTAKATKSKAEPIPKKSKKAEVEEQAAQDEAESLFEDVADDELGLGDDEADEPAEPEFETKDAMDALKALVARKVKKGMSEDNAKLKGREILATFKKKSVKDLTSDEIGALINLCKKA